MLLRFISKCAIATKLPFYARNSLRHYHREKISTVFHKTHVRFSSTDIENNQDDDEITNENDQIDHLIQKHLPSVNLDDPVMVKIDFFKFILIFKKIVTDLTQVHIL